MGAMKAAYNASKIHEYAGNPLIESLGPIETKITKIQKITNRPLYSKDELLLDADTRVYSLHRLYEIFQPLPIHIDIWNMIHQLLLEGYSSRNPFDKDYKRFINETGKQIIERKYDINTIGNFHTTASAALLVGVSGIGKTTSVNRILHQIPQIIVHNFYRREHFNQIQLTWLKLEVPHNSSLKALCLQYFMKLDELLGTNNLRKLVSRNLSVDAMIPLIGQSAQSVKLGILILDESQRLKNRENSKIVDFFVFLINSIGLPVLIIGTPSTYALFESEFRLARRLTGGGTIFMNRMERDDIFVLFLESIWPYQWTRKFVPLTSEYVELFYELTLGISDLVVKLYIFSQATAISSGTEVLTPDLIKRTADEKFHAMVPMLNAIHSNNIYKLSQFEDLMEVDKQKYEKKSGVTKQSIFLHEDNKPNDKKKGTTKTTPLSTNRHSKKNEYVESDLRNCLLLLKKPDFQCEKWLLEKGLIDDMTDWMGSVDC